MRLMRYTASPLGEGFNCAAPFRERLLRQPLPLVRCTALLQLCRSLSGAVIAVATEPLGISGIASIVPLPFGSGYLPCRCSHSALLRSFNCAAPFRERLYGQAVCDVDRLKASIVPLPFGSGYN